MIFFNLEKNGSIRRPLLVMLWFSRVRFQMRQSQRSIRRLLLHSSWSRRRRSTRQYGGLCVGGQRPLCTISSLLPECRLVYMGHLPSRSPRRRGRPLGIRSLGSAVQGLPNLRLVRCVGITLRRCRIRRCIAFWSSSLFLVA